MKRDDLRRVPLVGSAIGLAKRLRHFLDGEARHRDLAMNHSLADWFREVRAELSSLAIAQDASAQQTEALELAVARLEAELARLREAPGVDLRVSPPRAGPLPVRRRGKRRRNS